MIKENGKYVDSKDINGILWNEDNRWDYLLVKPLLENISYMRFKDDEKILVPYAERGIDNKVIEKEKVMTVEILKERYSFWDL